MRAGLVLFALIWPMSANADRFNVSHLNETVYLGAIIGDIQTGPDGDFFGHSGVDILPSGHSRDDLKGNADIREVLLLAGNGTKSAAEAVRIVGFEAGLDRIRIAGGLSFADLSFNDDGAGNLTVYDTINNQYIAVFENTRSNAVTMSDFLFSEF